MNPTLPGLDTPPVIRSLADIRRRMETAAAPMPAAPAASSPALPLPPGRIRAAWHRQDLRTSGYVLHLRGATIVRVQPAGDRWRVAHLGAHSERLTDTAAEADALAARIARMLAAE